jgi:hypothetical protein
MSDKQQDRPDLGRRRKAQAAPDERGDPVDYRQNAPAAQSAPVAAAVPAVGAAPAPGAAPAAGHSAVQYPAGPRRSRPHRRSLGRGGRWDEPQRGRGRDKREVPEENLDP